MPSDDPKMSLDDEFARARGLERDWLSEILRSRRRAWLITLFSGLLALTSVAAVATLVPMKEPPELYVVRVDNTTGVIDHVTHLGNAQQDYGERVARFFLNQYVLACESYDWYTLQATYNRCNLYSSPAIQKAYSESIRGSNGLQKRYASHTRVLIDVQSITLGPKQSATVRFTRRVESDRNQPPEVEHRVATLAYDYIDADLTEKVARENPLAFQVLAYKTDIEVLPR